VLVASPLLLMFGLNRENIAKQQKKKEEVVV
jgi:protein-export membrane protein secF